MVNVSGAWLTGGLSGTRVPGSSILAAVRLRSGHRVAREETSRLSGEPRDGSGGAAAPPIHPDLEGLRTARLVVEHNCDYNCDHHFIALWNRIVILVTLR